MVIELSVWSRQGPHAHYNEANSQTEQQTLGTNAHTSFLYEVC